MSSTREFAVRAVLSRFYKRDNSALTLLVAMIPLFRCSRFHRWVSSSISPLFRVRPPPVCPLWTYSHIYFLTLQYCTEGLGITPPNPVSAPVTTIEGSSAIPAPEIPIPRPIVIYNDYSNAYFLGACSNTFLHSQNGITGEDGRVLQPEELLAPRDQSEHSLIRLRKDYHFIWS